MVEVRGAFDQDEIDLLRDECADILRNPSYLAEDLTAPEYELPEIGEGKTPTYGYFTDMELSIHRPKLREFISKGSVAAIAARLTNSRAMRFMQDQLFVKKQGPEGGFTKWHQDVTYCAVSGDQVNWAGEDAFESGCVTPKPSNLLCR